MNSESVTYDEASALYDQHVGDPALEPKYRALLEHIDAYGERLPTRWIDELRAAWVREIEDDKEFLKEDIGLLSDIALSAEDEKTRHMARVLMWEQVEKTSNAVSIQASGVVDMRKVDLSQYDGDDKIIDSYEMKRLVGDEKHRFSVLSKIPALDHYCGGFVPGELIAVSGYTKHGKSLFSQTLTKNFYDQNVLSLWFSFELPPKQFLDCFDELPLLYMPKILKTSNMGWIENRIRESFAKYHTRVVFIDHLHYVVDIARTKSPSLEIGTVIRRLKLMAVSEGLIVFLMCHTKKKAREDSDFGEIRDSSFVEQESDAAFIISRFPHIEDDIACLRINQHRRTGLMQKTIWLQKQGNYLFETTNRDDHMKLRHHGNINHYWDD